jgi:LacI family transcriptional regulator
MMDVASLAGVSQATVSLVLNGSPGAKLSDATRNRVRTAAGELGYTLAHRRPYRTADSPRAILFLADVIASDPWMTYAYIGAKKKASEYGYNLFLAETNDDDDSEKTAIDQFDDRSLVGVIYGTILTRRVEPSDAVMRHRTVLLNCYDKQRKLHSILPGDLLGGRMATQRLIDAGRRRIGFINGQRGLDASRDRLNGYRQALSSNDIPYDLQLVKSGNWEPSSGYQMTRELLTLDEPPDAIFCANDPMAYGCFDALREAGLAIPGDVSVIGFDDRELAKYTHPPLTTLVLPQIEMGEIAAEFLIEMAGGHNIKPIQVKVQCSLVERESV